MEIPNPLGLHHVHPILDEMKERLENLEKMVFGEVKEKPVVETKEEGETKEDESSEI